MMDRVKNILNDSSGVSSYLTFIFVVFPLIVIIFAILEVANLSTTIISMNRGLMECSIKTATSPYPMSSDARWNDNLKAYVLSQGNSRTQLNPDSPINYMSQEDSENWPEPVPGALNVRIHATLVEELENTSIAPPSSLLNIERVSMPTVSSGDYLDPRVIVPPPTIDIKIQYRYRFIGSFLTYFLLPVTGNNNPLNSITITTGMKTINEHPNYILDDLGGTP